MSGPEVIVHCDAELLAKAVAARLVTRLVDAAAARGTASLVLTGGGIGTAVLAELAAAPARDAVDWRHLDVWWGTSGSCRPGTRSGTRPARGRPCWTTSTWTRLGCTRCPVRRPGRR